jgi:hypothetical protein
MGINYWCRYINLLLCATIGLFQRTCVDSHTTFVKFFSLLHRALLVVVGMLWWVGDNMHVALKGPWTCVCLLLFIKSLLGLWFLLYLFCWVWVPLLHICWFVVVMLWIWIFFLITWPFPNSIGWIIWINCQCPLKKTCLVKKSYL